NHSLVLLDGRSSEVGVVREIPERGARQFGRFMLVRKSLKTLKEAEKPREKNKEGSDASEDAEGDEPLNREVRFELHDIVKNQVVWSKDFPKEAPRYFFDDFSGRMI